MSELDHATIDLICPHGHASRHMLVTIEQHGHFTCPECLTRTTVPDRLIVERLAELDAHLRRHRSGTDPSGDEGRKA